MANKEMSKQEIHSQKQQVQSQDPQQMAFGAVQPSSSLSGSFIRGCELGFSDGGFTVQRHRAEAEFTALRNKDAASYDLGELDQALFLYLDGNEHSSPHEQKQTLNIFPSQPMHADLEVPSSANFVFKSPSDRQSQLATVSGSGKDVKPAERREGGRKGGTSIAGQEGSRSLDPKTLRRLAQNREAARKSRLRKKAYIQQLESSRIKLAQLEQELHRGVLSGAALGDQVSPSGVSSIGAEAAMFDAEYARWLEEHHRLMWELRAALQEQIPDNGLKMFVDGCLAHYDEMIILKSMLARSDVFHLISGIWKTPAERCFLWLGDFRPSDVIKIIVGHIEPLTEQQMMGVYSLRTSTDEAESSLTQSLEDLQRSLSDTIASNELSNPTNVSSYMGQMSMAAGKLSNLESLVRQADSLRQQTLHRLHQMLSPRQAAKCFLAVGEYFHRLRALSSLWQARPRQE